MPVVPSRSPVASPTGQQWVIGHGHQQAVITEVGATLRSYTVGGRRVIDGFGDDEWSESGRVRCLRRGRIDCPMGATTLTARNIQAASTSLRWATPSTDWSDGSLGAPRRTQNVVAMTCDLHPTPGYPFSLQLRVEYRLGREGLLIATTARNAGDHALPFGIGFHPYFTVGTDVIDTTFLQLPGHERLVLDDPRCPQAMCVQLSERSSTSRTGAQSDPPGSIPRSARWPPMPTGWLGRSSPIPTARRRLRCGWMISSAISCVTRATRSVTSRAGDAA